MKSMRTKRKWPYSVVGWLLPLPVTAIIVLLALAFRFGEPDFSLFVGYLGLLAWVPLGVLCAWIVFSGQLGLDDNGAFR